MKAAVRYRYGPPEVVELRDVERPVPSDGQVLVRVRAASVNRGDLDGLTPKPGFVRLFIGLRAPRDPRVGIDVAGVVEAVGPGVTRLKAGDQVMTDMFATGRFGAFAEYVCARETAFETIPAGMSFEEAATLPHRRVLALQGLRMRRRPHGQARRPGADRWRVGERRSVRGPDREVARRGGDRRRPDREDGAWSAQLGADHVIDYTKVDYTRTGERYDWIVDTDSHHPILGVRRALRPKGVYITLGGDTASILGGVIVGPLISLFSDKWTGLMLWWKPFHRPDVETLKELIAAGKLKPVIDRVVSLDEVVEALRYVEDGRAMGKVVISIPDPASPSA